MIGLLLLIFAVGFVLLLRHSRKRKQVKIRKLQWTNFIRDMECRTGNLPES